MSKPITALMQREMNRQEFLLTLGFGLASVMGFSTIIHLLTGKSFEKHAKTGYGSTAYGGGKK